MVFISRYRGREDIYLRRVSPHRHILGYSTGRPTMLQETSVIETIAASHVIGVLLSECAE